MSLRYVLSEALNNIRRNILVVMGAILAVFISLVLMLGTLVFGEIAEQNTLQWSEDVRVIAFLRDDFRDSEQLQQTIQDWDEVAEVFYFSKADAHGEGLELLKNNPTALQVLEDDPNLLPASLRVRPVDINFYDIIEQRLASSPGVDRISTAGPQVDALARLRDGLRIVFVILSVALGVAAVALIANTIHMAIYARREEIEIMRLVGASNWYIRIPFLLEGMIEGLVGSILSVGVVVGVYQMALDRLGSLPDFIDIVISDQFFWRWGLVTLGFGVLVGAVGSGLSLAVHRYLRS